MIFEELSRAHKTFLRYAQTHPKTMSMALLGGSALAGFVLFRIIDGGGNDDGRRDANQKMSQSEARLIAMLENAKESSWQENVSNAMDAQEQFMLPGRNRKEPKFMERIEQRSMEILRNQHKKIDDEKRRKREEEEEEGMTRFWK